MTDRIDKATGLTCYDWKTDILEAKSHWCDWFKGMNEQLLEMNDLPKLVLVCQPEKLDKELHNADEATQKLRTVVMENSGHCIQEEYPEETSDLINKFVYHFRIQYA